MKINSIGIIGGTGGLGARLASFFTHKFPELEILVSGRKTEISNKKIVQECDLVIFAVPISETVRTILDCVPFSREDQIWADITSIKEQPVKVMLEGRAEVCGLHPLFGPLPVIDGQPLIYCPARISETSISALLDLLRDFDLVAMTPTEHDRLMGVVQCVSHLSDFVMGEALRTSEFDFETIWRVSSPSYRSKLQIIGRMFNQSPDLYTDIATLNTHGSYFTAHFQIVLEKLKNLVDTGDKDELLHRFTAVRDYLGLDFCQESYRASQQFMSLQETALALPESGKIAVFGRQYSHTDEVVPHFFPGETDITYFSQISEAFRAVNEDRFESLIVPYENSTHGSVFDTLDSLWEFSDLQIVASRQVEIAQHLLGLPGSHLGGIKVVSSHPQALAQSREGLLNLWPRVNKIPARSTALAAQTLLAKQDLSQAVIGSQRLAEGLGLIVLAANLQRPDNKTRFVCIAKKKAPMQAYYLSLVCWFDQDKAGNLARVLQFLADQKINLTKLDSRRSTAEYGRYLFFIDAAVTVERFQGLMPEFEKLVSGFRVLGAFDD